MTPTPDNSSSWIDHSHNHQHESHENHTCHCDDDMTASNNIIMEEADQTNVLMRLKAATFLCCAFLLLEIVGGAVAGSLAVLSDAAHRATDILAYVVAIVASHMARAPPSKQYSFGFKRVESLVALFSMVTLAVMSIALGVEAVRRICMQIQDADNKDMNSVDGKTMAMISLIGVVVNIILALVLGEHGHVHMPGVDHHSHEHHSHEHHSHTNCHSHNEAYLHALADLAESVIVLIAGLLIWWKPSWHFADPICTIIFAVIVSFSTVGVIKASVDVLLEKVPQGVDWGETYNAICQVSGVSVVQELHIWSVSHGTSILSVHVLADDIDQAFHDIKKICQERNILKSTLQIRPSNESQTSRAFEW
eukprot:scaffold9359_cov49-Cyclotella_meneghiniana.AAC.5